MKYPFCSVKLNTEIKMLMNAPFCDRKQAINYTPRTTMSTSHARPTVIWINNAQTPSKHQMWFNTDRKAASSEKGNRAGIGLEVKERKKEPTKNMKTKCAGQGSLEVWTGDFFPHKTNAAEQMRPKELAAPDRSLKSEKVYYLQAAGAGM